MITTTDIINKVDNDGNIIVTKIRKTYNGSTIVKEEYLNNEDKSHRDGDLPASIEYYNDKTISIEKWYQNGEIHRDEDQPGSILYYKNGKINTKTWYKNGKRYRDNNLPNCINYNNAGYVTWEKWYQDNKLHRPVKNGPARIEYKNNKLVREYYYLDGKLVEKPLDKIFDEISKFSKEDIAKFIEMLKLIKK
jgi:antitoxin component YwqK of YwqJK toxin-antitoxin module